jgi:trehalose synthase
MLHSVEVENRNFRDMLRYVYKESHAREIETLARKLEGIMVAQINTAAREGAGGVSEILRSFVPLSNSLGLREAWYVVDGVPTEFFAITKKLHNGLQGGEGPNSSEFRTYLEVNEALSHHISRIDADLVVINDTQLAASIGLLAGNGRPVISRIHIDMSTPNPDALARVLPFLLRADKVVFSLPSFVPRALSRERVAIIPIGIDPLSRKNIGISMKECVANIEKMGIDPKRPIVAQVSRFDPWKDPIGVVRAYRLVRKEIPDVQLVLLGIRWAQDDPEADRIVEEVEKEVKGDPDIHLFSRPADLRGVSNADAVKSVQKLAHVVFQKSTREGFGLTATEAMWRGKAVIGGKAGGIAFQIKNGKNGYLVDTPSEAAKYAIRLLRKEALREKMGREAMRSVFRKFLMTSYVLRNLELYANVLGRK